MAFLANTNTKIKLANGQLMNIEDVKASNWILDKNNFPNNVRGVFNIPHKDTDTVIKINNELTCGSNLIFLGSDGLYYVYGGITNPAYVKMSRSVFHMFISNNDTISHRVFVGIPDNMIRNLEVGSILMTENGPKTVDSLEVLPDFFVDIPPTKDYIADHYSKDISEIDIDNLDTNDFNTFYPLIKYIVVARTATCIVNGYICVSLPNNNWDYENDLLMDVNSFEVVPVNGRYEKVPL
jgi:hypothetical protein